MFSKTSPNTKTRYSKQLLKHRVYGYDPLHKHGEISMFLTLSIKHDFYSLYPKPCFSKGKLFYENILNQECVSV